MEFPFPGYDENGTRWISRDEYPHFSDGGEFLQYDGSVSRIVHKWDRFGDRGTFFYRHFMEKQPWFNDTAKLLQGSAASAAAASRI